jgi:hypothetical protein
MIQLSRVVRLVIVAGFLVAGCGADEVATDHDAGADLSRDMYVINTPGCRSLGAGPAAACGAANLGQSMECSDWEHDICWACITVDGEPQWTRIGGLHNFACDPKGQLYGGGTCTTPGEAAWVPPSLCCRCGAGADATSWSCSSKDSTCESIDAGTRD